MCDYPHHCRYVISLIDQSSVWKAIVFNALIAKMFCLAVHKQVEALGHKHLFTVGWLVVYFSKRNSTWTSNWVSFTFIHILFVCLFLRHMDLLPHVQSSSWLYNPYILTCFCHFQQAWAFAFSPCFLFIKHHQICPSEKMKETSNVPLMIYKVRETK